MSFLVRLPAGLYSRHAFDAFVATAFGIGTARAMAWLAQLAYEDEPDKVDSVLRLWGARRIASFEHLLAIPLPVASTRGLVVERQGCLFIAFEGTDPFVVANWITNFNFVPDQDGIHQGFAMALEVCWPDITDAFRQAGADMPLFVAGHSLGAALAALCASRAGKDLGASVQGVYTFGMPRTGTADFARTYDALLGERTYRLVYGEDIIPTVPPSELGFAHVGRLLQCARGSRFDSALLTDDFSDEPRFLDGQLDGLRAGLLDIVSGQLPVGPGPDPLGRAFSVLPPGIADHLPDRYWAALESSP
jgi:hypothetical protein